MAEVDCAIAAPLLSSTATKVASPGPSSPEDLVNITTALQSLGFDLEIKCNAKPILGSTPSVALSFVNSGVRVSANSVSELSVSFNLQSARTAATVHNTANAGALSIGTPAYATEHATDTGKTESKQPSISSSTSEPPALAPEESDATASSEPFNLAPSQVAAGISNAEATDQLTSALPGTNQATTAEPNPAPLVSASSAFAALSTSYPVSKYATAANYVPLEKTFLAKGSSKNLQSSLCTCNAHIKSCESSANAKVDARTKHSSADEIQNLAEWVKTGLQSMSTIQRVLEEYTGSKRLISAPSPVGELRSAVVTLSQPITRLNPVAQTDGTDSNYNLATDVNGMSHPSHFTSTAETVTPSQSSAKSFASPPSGPPMTTGIFGASELSSASPPISPPTLTPLVSQLNSWSSTPILALGRFAAPPPAVTQIRILGKGKKKTFSNSMRVGNNLHWQDVDFEPFIERGLYIENGLHTKVNESYEHISMMPENRGMSPEEIRVQAYKIQD